MLLNKILLLLKTSRPIGWLVAPLIFLAGISSSGAEMGFLPILEALLLSFPFCLFLYGINDIYDYNSDKMNPRKKLLCGIKLEPVHHTFIKKASFFAATLLALVALGTGNAFNVLAIFLLVFFSYAYSAPPLRLKTRPPLDSLSNGAIYFLLPFMAGFSFGGNLFAMPPRIYLLSACVAGIHSFNTIMDYGVDKKAGDKTFAVVFGKRTAAFFPLIIFTSILFFARSQTPAVNYYLAFCSILFLTTAVFPREKRASLFFNLIFISSLAVSVVYLIAHMPHFYLVDA